MYFLIESFSNDDDAGNENAILKHEYFSSVLATFSQLFQYRSTVTGLNYYVMTNDVRVRIQKEKRIVMGLCSRANLEFGHFTM